MIWPIMPLYMFCWHTSNLWVIKDPIQRFVHDGCLDVVTLRRGAQFNTPAFIRTYQFIHLYFVFHTNYIYKCRDEHSSSFAWESWCLDTGNGNQGPSWRPFVLVIKCISWGYKLKTPVYCGGLAIEIILCWRGERHIMDTSSLFSIIRSWAEIF